ncbi:exoribonuclease-2 [Desulfosalsimonas propionicica]|uniref:Exoribonuclease-2 n=1 Tax=Desulfosalsimonas propionicica TaxID=332175 RepID=A0A7W0HMD1_9BACT|nr:RNB domain-containing ribonuclease [Desulfosalsimonas propionicica]MBA2882951.1 exoribonuclease-2 [Desulfosalsimonas propionicica]
MEPGTVVEYIDQQRIICAVVLEQKDERLRLLNENNREINQKAARLSHVSQTALKLSQGRDQLVESLKTIGQRRQALSAHINIKEIWEAVHSLEEWIDLDTMTSFCFSGEPDSDQESAVIRAFFENRIYFKFSHDWFYPHSEEVVENNIARQEAEQRRQQLVEEGGQWVRAVLNNGSSPPDADPEVIELLKSYYLYGKESARQATARAILTRAGVDSAESIFSVMVRAGHWQAHENLDLYRYEIPMEFPGPVLKNAAELDGAADQIPEDAHRRDLTELDIITIDGQGTMDYDDALSVQEAGKNLRIGVHISDVAARVEKGGVIDQDVISRGTSIYMPDLKIPMLPATLAEDVCSLVEGQRRPAISTFFTVTPYGEVVDYEIVPSVIRVSRQMSYSETDAVAQSDDRIRALHAAAQAFKKRRLENGAVQILLPELYLRVCSADDIRVRVLDRESPGRLLVAEMMIMANWVMARFLAEKQMPAIFRAQNHPRGRLYSGTDEGTLFQNWMQRRMLSRVILGTRADYHSGLGLDAYITATSPIRKYFDLVTQRQLRACLGLEQGYSDSQIEEILQLLQPPLTHARLVQNRRMRFWILKYLEGMIGSKAEAIVLDRRRDGYTILLRDYLMEARLPSSAGVELKPKDLARVTFQHVDAARDKLTVYLG